MADKSNKQGLKRFFIITSGLLFLGGTIMISLPNLFGQGEPDTQQTSTTQQTPNANEQLKQEAQGYEQVLKREPDNVTALQGLASARLQMQDFQGAIAPLEKLSKIYPDDPKITQFLAESYLRTDNLQAATPLLKKIAKTYEEDLKEHPNEVSALKGLAAARLQMQDYQGAREPLETLYKLEPDNPQVIQYLAEVRQRTNDLPGTIELLEKLAQLQPENENLKQVLAQLKQQQPQTSPQK